MYTSIVLVALAGSAVTAAAVPESLEWNSDYVAARKLGSRERKPLAIFVGSGPKGWEQRSKDGQLSRDAQALLKAHYVCVYVDATSEAGKRLAREFEMDAGIVLSDAKAENQAFRHAGSLTSSDLERQLKKYSDPERVATRTETSTREDVRYYPPTQEYTPAPAFAPWQGSFPSSGRNC